VFRIKGKGIPHLPGGGRGDQHVRILVETPTHLNAEQKELLDANLRLHRPRFGQRLRFDISFPEALLRCQLPSMVLLTLVENSIRHGLAPSPEGGSIQLSAEAAVRCVKATSIANP